MNKAIRLLALLAAVVIAAPTVLAQDKPTIAKYLSDGYGIIHSDVGGQFLQFILRKDNDLVWCSALIQTGQTVSCRNIK
jgi:hypothetical protein